MLEPIKMSALLKNKALFYCLVSLCPIPTISISVSVLSDFSVELDNALGTDRCWKNLLNGLSL